MANFRNGKIGYTLQLGNPSVINPLDNTTYYIGGNAQINTTEGSSRVYIPKTGIIKKCYISFIQIAGSNQTSTINIRVNNTTNTVVSSNVTNDAQNTNFSNNTLSIPVTEGNYIELEWVTPTWNPNPTAVIIMSTIYIE